MKTKEKSWLWYLTFPFAHRNYTIVFGTIYYPKGRPPSDQIIAHEQVHVDQVKKLWGGWWSYYFLYLLVMPLLYNPFRWKWEWEAYKQGSKWSDDQIRKKLRSAMYGWLICHKNR